MASYPTFNPAEFVDGISDAEWKYLTDESSNAPLNNWAIQGQYAPGSTFKPFSAISALQAGLITPAVDRLRRRRVRGARLQRRVVRLPQRQQAPVRRRRPASLPHGVVRLLLLRPRRSLLDRAGRPRRPGALRRPAEAVGLRRRHRDRPLQRAVGAHPVAGVAPAPSATQIECVDGTWRTGNNVNMSIGQGDVLLTPLQLASGYATIGNGGTVWEPHVVKEVRDGVTKEVTRTIEPGGLNKVEMLPEWRGRASTGWWASPPSGRHRGRRLQRLPQRHLPDRGQDRHGPGERQGAHRRVRGVRPGHRPRSTPSPCCSRSPATAGRWPHRSPVGSSTCWPTRRRCRPRPTAASSRCSAAWPRITPEVRD